LDWEWLASETVRRGYGDWVHLALKIVSDTLKTPIPDSFFIRVPSPPQFERLHHLACEQIWAERKYRVDFLVSVLAQPGPKTAASLLFRRFRPDWRGVDSPTVPPVETLNRGGLLLSFRRAVTDLRVKTPRYWRAWCNGILGLSSLQRARRLEKGRMEIQQILVNRLRV